MRRGGGKAKGSQFEREMCVRLSSWISGGVHEDIFWRSAMSGGRATVGSRKGKKHSSQVGDISCVHPLGHYFADAFALECKFYANLDYAGLLTGKGKLLAFWDEINKQARTHNKLPLLIAKQNRFPIFVCLNESGIKKLKMCERNFVLHSYKYDIWLIEAEKFFKKCVPYVAPSWRSSPNRPRKRLLPI